MHAQDCGMTNPLNKRRKPAIRAQADMVKTPAVTNSGRVGMLPALFVFVLHDAVLLAPERGSWRK